MLRKIINFYVVAEAGRLYLQVFELHRLDQSTPVLALLREERLEPYEIEEVVEAIYADDLNAIEVLQPVLQGREVALLRHFNQLPGSRESNRDLLRAQLTRLNRYRDFSMNWSEHVYVCINNMTEDEFMANDRNFYLTSFGQTIVHDGHHPDQEYAYHHYSIELSDNRRDLLKYIGSLDSLLHRIEAQSRDHNYQLSVNYCEDRSYLLGQEQFVNYALGQSSAGSSHLSPFLARFVVTRMMKEIDAHPQELCAYNDVLSTLNEIVKSTTPYLCRTIHQMLHPAFTIHAVASVALPRSYKLIYKLFDENISSINATIYLMDWLLNQLAEVDFKKRIEDCFVSVESVRSIIWHETIDSLFGLPASDGGYYDKDYAVIGLLHEASLRINEDGLIQLDVYNSKSYQQHYRMSGTVSHSLLETELRMACRYLGLEFLEGLDFHKKIVFTRESSAVLMNRGLHYSLNHAKSLARASHYFRFFASLDSQQDVSVALPLELKMHILSFVEPTVPSNELRQMSVRSFK